MKTPRIRKIRIHLSDKKAPVPIQETVNNVYVRWVEKELTRHDYDKETKISIIERIMATAQL